LPFGAGQCCQFLPLAFWVLTLPTPNITVKWITFLLCICEVQGSNFDLEADYSEVFRTFSDSLVCSSTTCATRVCLKIMCKL
jgi:hypothetical protein